MLSKLLIAVWLTAFQNGICHERCTRNLADEGKWDANKKKCACTVYDEEPPLDLLPRGYPVSTKNNRVMEEYDGY